MENQDQIPHNSEFTLTSPEVVAGCARAMTWRSAPPTVEALLGRCKRAMGPYHRTVPTAGRPRGETKFRPEDVQDWIFDSQSRELRAELEVAARFRVWARKWHDDPIDHPALAEGLAILEGGE